MWSYYGSKRKIAKHYPEPVRKTIIEPFAGTAAYSLYGDRWKKEVILVDKYSVIVDIWKYLQQASEKDIRGLPDMAKGDKVTDHKHLTVVERSLIGFCINRGNPRPVITANNYNNWNRDREKIADNLYRIRHWTVVEGSYTDIDPNIDATWFIDPPYQVKGYKYKHNKIDFKNLSKWVEKLEGQVIVCENVGANWLEFDPLVEFTGVGGKNNEAIYYRERNGFYTNLERRGKTVAGGNCR